MDGPEQMRTIGELRVAADPAAWDAAGFEVSDGLTRVGTTPIRFLGPDAGRGLLGWTLDGPEGHDYDGLPTDFTGPSIEVVRGNRGHPNSALGIDHVVVFTSDLERTIAAFEAGGVRCRRIRELGPPEGQLRQAFFRFGSVIAEVVQVSENQAGPGGSARFWGLTLVVEDLEGAVADLGERIGTIRDAVQPGRRIATLRREAGLGLPVALISPEPEPEP